MKPIYRLLPELSAFAAVVFAGVLLSAAEPQAARPEAVNYGRPFEPPTRRGPSSRCRPARWSPRLAPRLVPGGQGRLHRAHGRVHQEFKRAWAADHKMTGDRLNLAERRMAL